MGGAISDTQARARGDVVGLIKWMSVGVVQTVVWSAATAVLWLIRSPGRAQAMDRAARGLCKVLWAPMFEPKFYGQRELARLERLNPSAA
jgi:succinoglycan biosynthesis protein ExoM